MSAKKQKKLHNRFDEWEVLSIFNEATEDYLSEEYSTVNRKFYLRCVLGVLLAVNGYLSHFGPWTWPGNYYFLVFSVIFYYIGSSLYSRLGDVSGSEGTKVG